MLCLKLHQLPPKRLTIGMAVHDHIHHMFELSFYSTEITHEIIALLAMLTLEPLPLKPIRLNRLCHNVGRKEVISQRD